MALLLAVAYGASIGGIATLIGTPPNAFLAGYMAQEHGLEIGFAQWMMFALPLSLVMLGCCWLTLTRIAFRLDGRPIAQSRRRSARRLTISGPTRRPEKTVAVVFALAALAWIAQPLIATVIPNLSDTVIAILAALALFIVPAGGGKPALNWEHASRVPYGLLLLFGGGLSLAAAFGSTGLAFWLAGGLGAAAGLPAILVILLIVATIVFLTELTSNIATTAAMVPLLAGVAVGAGIHPLLLCAPAALAASCAFMLPVATPPNAVVFGAKPCHDPANGQGRFLAQPLRHRRRDGHGLCAARLGLSAGGMRPTSTPRGRRCARLRTGCGRARWRSARLPGRRKR